MPCVQRFDALYDFRHLVDCVDSFLRRGAVRRKAVRDYAHLRLALVAERYHVVGRLAYHDEVGAKAELLVHHLDVLAVAVLLADASADAYAFARRQPAFARERRAVYRGREAALHIDGAASVDAPVLYLGGEGRKNPLVRVVHLDVVHVRVEVDELFAVADESDRVARAVDEGLVVAELLHFSDDRLRDAALLVRVAAYAHELAREFDYIFLKSVRQRHKPALPA